MDQKRRTILVVAIAITIIAGVLSGFGLPFFLQTADIVLPNLNDSAQSQGDGGGVVPGENADYTMVRVTPETVQDVIATLHRQEQYYREVKVERFWGSNTNRQGAIYTSLIWNDGAYNKTALRTSDGVLRNCLTADGTAYVWYGSDKTWFEYEAADKDTDLEQNIPTYEDVLGIKKENILRAGYDSKPQNNCIFVEAKQEELGYLERYWVSVDTGLLVAAETEKDGQLVYSMAEKLIKPLLTDDSTFRLPNGKVLHGVVVAETEE